jgi:hypothetical protein
MFIARFLFIVLLLLPLNVFAGVAVPDMIIPEGKSIQLSARAKKGFFSQGGTLVEFSVDGKTLGKTLSGGDSIAYMEYLPESSGIHEILVTSKDETGRGSLLVVTGRDQLLFVDVREALFADPLGGTMREGALDALSELSETYRIVYLRSGLYPRVLMKEWLHEKGFKKALLLNLGNGRIIKKIKSDGIKVSAVVAGPEAAVILKREDVLVLSFEKVDGTTKVDSWLDVEKALNEGGK